MPPCMVYNTPVLNSNKDRTYFLQKTAAQTVTQEGCVAAEALVEIVPQGKRFLKALRGLHNRRNR